VTTRIALSVGCPCGIGPEVSVVAAASAGRGVRVLLVGDFATVAEAARARRVGAAKIVRVEDAAAAWELPAGRIGIWQPTPPLAPRDRRLGAPTRASGAAQLAWIDQACALVARGDAEALVTGPVSKDAISRSGAPGSRAFLGHTEHLQRLLRAREVVMSFWSEELVTSLATTHIPLSHVARQVTAPRVASAAYWLVRLITRLSGKRRVRIAVAGLNPHAGEHGLLGREESIHVAPGIARARARLRTDRIDATIDGPVPAESAFRLARDGRWDGVVALYHDQATIPMKLLGFGDAVNVTLGLPIVRTSVDHGTAYDRAGRWDADAAGMGAAIALAVRLSRRA
jgi:4-hydroxythreonine-4-phosphate dehydrogenase